MKNLVVLVWDTYWKLSSSIKRALWLIVTSQVLLMISYPFVRSSSEAIFFAAKGAKNSPVVWLQSMAFLFVVFGILNHFQQRWGIKKIYAGISFFSLGVFLFSLVLPENHKGLASLIYVTKEAYIVLLLHMAIAFLNTLMNLGKAKILYGPIGGLLSIGAVTGGYLSSWLSTRISSEELLVLGGGLIVISGLVFLMIDSSLCLSVKKETGLDKRSLFISLAPYKKYGIAVVLLLMCSQFVVNILDYQFKIILEANVAEKALRSKFISDTYIVIDALSFIFKVIVAPIFFRFASLAWAHYFLPFICVILGIGSFLSLKSSPLTAMAIFFSVVKSLDYSLFSVAKEMLYFVLPEKARYGLKYLADIISYRGAKGIISFFLLAVGTGEILFLLLSFCLIGWIIIVKYIFILFPKLTQAEDSRQQQDDSTKSKNMV